MGTVTQEALDPVQCISSHAVIIFGFLPDGDETLYQML